MTDPFAEDLAKKGLGAAADDPFAADLARKGLAGGLTPERKSRLQTRSAKYKQEIASLQGEDTGNVGDEILKAGESLAGDFANAATLGGYRALRNTVGAKVAPETVRGMQENEAEMSAVPGYGLASGVVQAGGGGVGVPGAIYGKIAAPLTEGIANPLLRAALRGGVGGALTSGGQAAVEGAPLREQAKEAGKGALIGAGTDVGLASVGAAGRAVSNSKGAQARELIEKYGGKVGPTNSGSGGAFDQELQGLPASDRGIGEASQRGAGRILSKADEIHDTRVRQPYVEEKARIDAGEGRRPVNVDDIHHELVKAYQSPKLNEGQRSRIRTEIDALERRYSRPDLGGQHIMTEEQLNDYKTMLQGLSKAGQSGDHTIPEALIGKVASTVKAKVDQGPYAELNARYREGALEKSDLRRGLGLGPRASSNDLAEENRVRNLLMRQTQDTTTAGATTMDLEQIRKAYPELARELDLPELLAAKSSLKFGLGEGGGHGGLIARLKHQGVPAAAGYGLGALLGHGPAGAAVATAGSLVGANAAPIAGRLLYRPGQLAAPFAEAGANPLIQAALQKKARDEAAARNLFRGH